MADQDRQTASDLPMTPVDQAKRAINEQLMNALVFLRYKQIEIVRTIALSLAREKCPDAPDPQTLMVVKRPLTAACYDKNSVLQSLTTEQHPPYFQILEDAGRGKGYLQPKASGVELHDLLNAGQVRYQMLNILHEGPGLSTWFKHLRAQEQRIGNLLKTALEDIKQAIKTPEPEARRKLFQDEPKRRRLSIRLADVMGQCEALATALQLTLLVLEKWPLVRH